MSEAKALSRSLNIAVDWDGTLSEYHGWEGEGVIGAMIPRMVERCKEMLSYGHRIYIFTARDSEKCHNAIFRACELVGIQISGITNKKEKFFDQFWDDRAIGVVKNTGITLVEKALQTPAKDQVVNCLDNLLNKGSSLDNQVGGSHYKDMVIQPAEYCEYNNLPALEGNAIKYLSRHGKKNGREDLKKAIDIIEMIIDMRYSTNGVDSLLQRIAVLRNKLESK